VVYLKLIVQDKGLIVGNVNGGVGCRTVEQLLAQKREILGPPLVAIVNTYTPNKSMSTVVVYNSFESYT
jgi:hypothetical protein